MTYTHSRTYRIAADGALAAHLAKPTTLAVEIGDLSFIDMQRGDVLETRIGTVRHRRKVTWTTASIDQDGRVIALMAGLGDEVEEDQA